MRRLTRDIWHFLNSAGGGVARFVEQLAAAQVGPVPGQGPAVYVTGPPNLNLPATVHRYNYVRQPKTWGLNQWWFAAFAWRQLHLAGRRRPSARVIHTHSFAITRPDVHTVHGLYSLYSQTRPASLTGSGSAGLAKRFVQQLLLSRFERQIINQAKAVAFVSTHNREYVETVLNVRRSQAFSVILPGVDLAKYNPTLRQDLESNRRSYFPELDPARRWMLFVGHDFQGKGLFRLLDGLSTSANSGDWQLLVIGDDTRNAPAARQSAARLPAGRVCFLGRNSRLEAAYALSDVLLMDSISEGFPLVLLEAIASGCVPIVSQFGGVSDIVENGVNGMVLPGAIDIAQCAVSIAADQVRTLSENAVRTGSLRSWLKVASEYADLYSSL
jgi:glycosyltransferase involved in cell wall biosynthesis